MNDRFIAVASLLIDIEQELRVMGLWESEMPSTEALSSTEPFAIDRLSFTQWLQFIFIPKMALLIEQQSLPANCSIAPMAEEVFAQSNYASGLIAHLRRIDHLLSN
jgi:uncharacterized protein YqcC (DUF446 family)